jgi:hypothetical protein
MEESDIDSLKEREDVKILMDAGFQFPYDEYSKIHESIRTYRFGHDVENEEFKNHETTYTQRYKNTDEKLPPEPFNTCALSCFTSEEAAEAKLQTYIRVRKNIRLRMGNSLFIGTLLRDHGFVSDLDDDTHFNFFQKECCNMHDVFQLHRVLSR